MVRPRFAHAVIVAEAVFGERSIDLIGEPQWIVAVILGTGHSCIRSRSGLSPPYSARVIRVSARRVSLTLTSLLAINAIAIFWTTIAISGLRWSKIGDNSAQKAVSFRPVAGRWG